MARLDVAGRPCAAAAEVREFDLSGDLKFPKNQKYMTLPVQYATRAALDATRCSGFSLASVPPERLALYVGSGQTGLESEEFFRALSVAWTGDREHDYRYLGGRGPTRLIDPYFSLKTLSNVGIALLSAELGFRGSSANFVHGETAGVAALQSACYDLIEDRCDAALVGGYDSLLRPSVFLSYESAGLLSPSSPESAFRPFDAGRDGIVLGEGAAFLFLERLPDAKARGAPILGSINGTVCSLTAGDDDTGVASINALHRAVAEFLAKGFSLDYIMARGIGTVEHDLREAELLETLAAGGVPVTALKGATGYNGAATALVELGIGLLCSRERFVPAIVRCTNPDPRCQVDLVTSSRPLKRDEPAGLFVSRTWAGPVAAILASASCVEL